MKQPNIRAIALTLFSSSTLVICNPAPSPQIADPSPLYPDQTSMITAIPRIGTIPPQTVTDSNQVITYDASSTTTTSLLTWYSTAGVFTQGCLTTTLYEPGIYTLESPQEVYYYCAYSTYALFDTCPMCQKEVEMEQCQFGNCNYVRLELNPWSPSSTYTYIVSEYSGYGCTPSVAGGGEMPSKTSPESAPAWTTSSPLTTITENYSIDFTVTVGNTVIVGVSVPSAYPTPPNVPYPPPSIPTTGGGGPGVPPPSLPPTSSPGVPSLPAPSPHSSPTTGAPGIPGVPGVPSLPLPPSPTTGGAPGIPGIPGIPSLPLPLPPTTGGGAPGIPGIPGIPSLPLPSLPTTGGGLPGVSQSSLPIPTSYTSPSVQLSTVYFPGGGIITKPYTTTTQGITVVYVPYTTITSFFNPASSGIATTITDNKGTVSQIIPYALATSYFATPGSAYTMTASGTIFYITAYVTSTNYYYTVGTPSTSTAAAAGSIIVSVPNNSCGNSGLKMGVYNMTQNTSDDDPTFSTFDPADYKTTQPVFEDASTSPFMNCTTSLCAVYNATTPFTASTTFLVIDWHGFFVAQSTGNYTFATKLVDDIAMYWFGDNAILGWTRDNADLIATFGNYPGDNQVHTVTKTLTAGSYLPIRIIWANGDGSGIFDMTVTGPTGQPLALMGNNLVQFPCDHSLAPAFPDYGSET